MSAPEHQIGIDTTVEASISDALKKAHRIRWVGVAVVGIVLVTTIALLVSLLVTSERRLNSIEMSVQLAQSRLISSCRFYADLAPLPITVNPATHTASELAVRLVIDARRAFIGQGCPGELLAPSISLIRWANYYHLQVPS